MESCLLPIVGKIGEYSVPPIGEQFGYIFSYKSSIAILKEILPRLLEKKEAVQQSVVGAQWNQKVVPSEVMAWLKNVEKKIEEVQRILEDDRTNRMCLNGWCPDLKLRYSLGRKAQKNSGEIVELLKEGEKYDTVYNDEPPLEVRSLSTERFKDFESRKSMISDILGALRDDKINMIALCGMGGIGKTEMAKEIDRRVKADSLFNKTAIAAVSLKQDLIKVQDEIAEKLGPKLDEKALDVRAYQLYSRLTKNKNVLIILDDVWKPLDLEAIGIYNAVKEKSCKILLTSRSEETCNQMRIQKIFQIGLLSEEEAWNLFRETAGDCINTPNLISIAEQVAKECARLPIAIATVGGALINKSDEYEWKAALQQLRMSIPEHITDLQQMVYSSIEFSYNYLESNEAKSCFLLCCLYPEDYDIPVEHLVRYGVAKRFLKGGGVVEDTRAHVNTIVRNLQRSNLLLDSDWNNCVKMHDVVRDVAVSITSRSEHRFIVELDRRHEEWPQNDTYDDCTAISILLDKMKGPPNGLKFPKLQLLQLFLCSKDLKILPENLFDGMKELKILSAIGTLPMMELHCFRHSEIKGLKMLSLPLSIQILENIRLLNLESCILGDVSAIGTLGKLEMLGFRGSVIKELPREIGNLGQLKLLDMKGCYPLKRIAAGVLSSLSQLQELYIGTFKNWECITTVEGNGEGTNNNASLVELIPNSGRLVVLEISVRSIECLPKELHFNNPSLRFRIITSTKKKRYKRILYDFLYEKYLFENRLCLELEDGSNLGEYRTIRPLLKKSAILELDIARNSKNIWFVINEQQGFSPSLKDITIRRCEDLEYLIEATSDNNPPTNTLPLLKSLTLGELDNLKEIYQRKILGRPVGRARGVLGNLKNCWISKCKQLRNIFWLAMVIDLVQLQKLEVKDCENIQEIFSKEGEEDNAVGDAQKLPELENIALFYLPRLIGICASTDSIEIQQVEGRGSTASTILSHKLFSSNTILWVSNLKRLSVIECGSLEVLFDLKGLKVKDNHQQPIVALSQLTHLDLSYLSGMAHVWKNIPHGFQGFQNLRSIQIFNCHGLRNLVPLSVAKLLVKLQTVQICHCKLMENIIEREEDTTREEMRSNIILLPKIHTVEQFNFENLVNFNSETHSFEWSFIKEIKLQNCPKLRTFSLEVKSGRKLRRKMDAELGVRAQETCAGSSAAIKSFGLFNRCLELSCVPRRKNYSPVIVSDQDNSKLSSQGIIGACNKEVTLTKQEERNVCETENQTKMWSLFPYNLIEGFRNLEQLEATKCDSLEVIFELEGLQIEESNIFNNLVELTLKSLPKLLHVWKKGPQDIKGFNNLRFLQVWGCHSLRCLFTPSLAKILLNLKEIKVHDCNEMEEILAKESGYEEKRHVIAFPLVKTLSLMDLPKLECFYPEDNYAFEWPYLSEIRIAGCQKLKMFVATSTKTPKLRGVHMESKTFLPMVEGDLNATIQHIIKGKGLNESSSNSTSSPSKLRVT